MIDLTLARRILNKVQKELLELNERSDDLELAARIQSVSSKIDLMYDILHLDEIEMIDIRPKQTK